MSIVSMGNNDDGYHTTHLRVAGQPALTLMRIKKTRCPGVIVCRIY